MRVTLVIDDDVHLAAKALAETQRKTIGEVISAVARHSLSRNSKRNGVPLLDTNDSTPVTLKFVNNLRDELVPSSSSDSLS